MKIYEVKEHGESISKGMMAALKLCALIDNAEAKSLLQQSENWCLFFDLHIEVLNENLVSGVSDVPLHLVSSLTKAIQKTQHLRYEAIKKTLYGITFKANAANTEISTLNVFQGGVNIHP